MSPLHVCTDFLGQRCMDALGSLQSLWCMSPALAPSRLWRELTQIPTDGLPSETFWNISWLSFIGLSFRARKFTVAELLVLPVHLSLAYHFYTQSFTSKALLPAAVARLLVFVVCPAMAQRLYQNRSAVIGATPIKNANAPQVLTQCLVVFKNKHSFLFSVYMLSLSQAFK